MTAGRHSGMNRLLPPESIPHMSYGLFPPAHHHSAQAYGSYQSVQATPPFPGYLPHQFPVSDRPSADVNITEVSAGATPHCIADLDLLNLKLPAPSQ
jgi:hypothetical protein